MHSAPAVVYPVGRSSFQLGIIAIGMLLGVLQGVLWWLQLGQVNERVLLFGVVWLAAVVLASADAWRTPAGHLRWRGDVWTLAQAQSPTTGEVRVVMDLQGVMLLSWRHDSGKSSWLWVERRRAPPAWRALRCALVAHGYTPSRPAPDAEAQEAQVRQS